MDSNALAFIGKYVGYDSEEYQLSRYYITGASFILLSVKQQLIHHKNFNWACHVSHLAGQGDNPLLMDLNNASQQLVLANQSITSYGSEVCFHVWFLVTVAIVLLVNMVEPLNHWCARSKPCVLGEVLKS